MHAKSRSPRRTKRSRPKPRRHRSTTSVESGRNLWNRLLAVAGLDPSRYDTDLVRELATRFDMPIRGFRNSLTAKGIGVEELLVALIEAASPYARMMSDILAFFSEASAKSSQHNLRFRFEFDRAHCLEFDLENFREYEARVVRLNSQLPVDRLDPLRASELRHLFITLGSTYRLENGRHVDIVPSEPNVRQWLDDSSTSPRARRSLPSPPSVNNTRLAALLNRTWNWMRWALTSDQAQVGTVNNMRAIVRGAYLLRTDEASLLGKLSKFFSDVADIETDVTMLVHQIEELFNLPVWQRRSEVYSIWVGVQLMSAFGSDVRVHPVKQSIVFSFGGAHLATVRRSGGRNLLVWCECRQRVSKVIGKGRKTSIQPDYTLFCEPAIRADSAVLVVECKQYAQQSREGFAKAIVDYANGHQNAHVVLVNYGEVTDSVMQRVEQLEAAICTRVSVVGTLRPGPGSEAPTKFQAFVRSIVSDHGDPNLAEPESPGDSRS